MARHYRAEVKAVNADGSVRAEMLEGPLAGLVASEDIAPSFPAGTWLPPQVGDVVLVLWSESKPPGEPYYIGADAPDEDTAEIVIDGSRNVLLRQGTLGVARLTDSVSAASALSTWMTAVNAAIGALDAGTPVTPPAAPPATIGAISSASATVLAGD